MAESIMISSTSLLGKILVQEGKYLWGAEGKVKELRDELLWMQSFLREAETFQHKDEILRLGVWQVQGLVSEAEDIIDKFVIQVLSRRLGHGFLNKLRRYSCFLREFYYLHRVASSIDSLRDETSRFSSRFRNYSLTSSVSRQKDQVGEARVEDIQHIWKNAHLEEKKIVGFENNAKEIIGNLTSPGPKRFYAIYRMGGGGKTTLAMKAFKDDKVKRHFTGGQAFVCISKQFHVESVLEVVHTHLKLPDRKTVNKSLDVLVQEYLKQNKCLLVLDNVWKKEDWDCLKCAFALGDGDSCSKVLLTTRNKKVAEHVDSGARQMPDPLKDEDAWELLQRTMGWAVLKASSTSSKQVQDQTKTDGTNDGSKVLLTTSKEDVAKHPIEVPESSTSSSEIQEQTNTDDTNDLTKKTILAKKMLKVCRGSPFFIVVLGGILRKKQTLDGWKSVLDNITSHLRAGYDYGRLCMEILVDSYNDLPYYLKPCFLHLANFPEDYEISTQSLYQMWVAEGLVTRWMHGTSMEDVANDYLNSLAQVGLVEIVDATSEGWIISIRMCDLVRDVCYEKAATNNVLKTIDLRLGRVQVLDTFDYCGVKRLVRMAIYLPEGSIESFIEDYLSSKSPECLRSLLLFHSEEGPSCAECEELMTCICSEFQSLRVLDIGNIRLSNKLTSKVENLIHLRYLRLADTFVAELPSCIGKLRFLETLDLRVRTELVVPNTLWKLFRLRHLLFPSWGYRIKGSEMLRVDTLTCLEVIENLVVKNLETKGMRKIKNLRQLSIVKGTPMSRKEAEDIIVAIKSNCSQRFFLEIEGNAISQEAPVLLSSVTFHVELEISGKIQGGNLGQLPQYLEELILSECHIKDDPMGILGRLDHLKSLTFNKGSYAGMKLSCASNSFPLLERLIFSCLEVLEEWELGSGSMPKLNSLVIEYCDKLMRTPCVLPLSLQEMTLEQEYGPAWKWSRGELLDGESANIVSLGKGGVVVDALEDYYFKREVARPFDAVARTVVPRSRSCRTGGGLLPRGSLQKLLRDLRDPKQSREGQNLSRMSCHDLLTELQQVMQERRCLVIVVILEVDVENVQVDLENTFGNPRSYGQRGSKLLIISESDTETSLPAKEYQIQRHISTQLSTWQRTQCYVKTNAGIRWNMLTHCMRQGLPPKMCQLILRDENFTKWEKFIDSRSIEPSPMFTLYYNVLLEPYLRHCLIYLANFPEEIEISTKKLHQMWIAAGIIGSNQEDVLTEESLENLANRYLEQLKDRGMVTALKKGPAKRVKICRLEFELRDLCLAIAKEEHKLQNPLNPASFAIHLDQNSVSSASLIEKLGLLEAVSSTTSLLFFPYVNDPLYNEESWEWLLYICRRIDLLRVLDLKGMWMTKGSLPKEIGELRQLRYLSLRGTWVTQLPQSIEDLSHLQTLDLRVWEPIIIPNVLWKLHCLMHLYLPDFITEQTAKLQLSGSSCLETLVNLHTDKVCLTDLLELKLLKKISIRNIHAVEVVDELDGILKQLSMSPELCINSEIINANPTILAGFQNLHNLKIKGMISGELHPTMFPANLEEVTLKHTKLEEDPIPVLENLSQLRRLRLEHESYLGKEMTFSKKIYERATKLVLCSLINLETLHSPEDMRSNPSKIDIDNCWRVEKKELPTTTNEEEEHVRAQPRTFDLSSLKKGLKSLTCC